MIYIIILLLCLIFYFTPSIIAHAEKRKQETAIIWLNILAGWTIIGWLVALIWSLIKPNSNKPVQTGDTKKCPKCAELIKKDAVVCRYCGSDLKE